MPTPFQRPPNRALIIVACASAFVGGFAVLAAMGIGPQSSAESHTATPSPTAPSPTPNNLTETGRLLFSMVVDAASMDESGQPVPGSGYAITQTCEADALAVIEDGRVTEVQSAGTADSIAIGERLKGPAPHQGALPVYRDENGDLHQGCDPDSVVIIKIE